MIKNDMLSLEEILEKKNESFEIEKSHFFETVSLNIPSIDDIDDSKISSLFGENEVETINTFVYEKPQETKKSFFDNSKIKVASLALASSLVLTAVFSIFSNIDNNDFIATASPMPMIMSQNLNEKTEMIKEQIVKGIIANESDYLGAYKIKSDDTVVKIAQKLNVATDTIKSINSILDDKDLVKRENILVPLVEGLVHKIKSGETIETIANKYKTTADKLIATNKIKNPNFISENQVLFIPKKATRNQVSEELKKYKKNTTIVAKKETSKETQSDSREQHRIHRLGKDQTLEYLAQKYNVSVSKILEANKNVTPENLQIGQPIIIPGKVINRNENRNRGVKLSSRSLQAGFSSNGLISSGRFLWPAKGEFSSGFGPRSGSFHKGIDIAANTGTPIYASMGGVVSHAGTRWEYGNTVEITHSNGMVTRYGHCSKIFVKLGQRVEAGQHIAAIGSTGRSTGPHVHFEILVNGIQVNPRNYL